jgi:hypothetical protein
MVPNRENYKKYAAIVGLSQEPETRFLLAVGRVGTQQIEIEKSFFTF